MAVLAAAFPAPQDLLRNLRSRISQLVSAISQPGVEYLNVFLCATCVAEYLSLLVQYFSLVVEYLDARGACVGLKLLVYGALSY